MRSLAVIAFLVATVYAGYTPIHKEIVKPVTEECQAHLGSSQKDAETVYMYRTLSTQTQACLQYCVYARLGLINGTQFAPLETLMAMYNRVYKEDSDYLRVGQATVQDCVDEVNALVTDDTCLVAKYMQECVNIKSLEKITHLGPPAP